MASLRKRTCDGGFVYVVDFRFKGSRHVWSTKTDDRKLARKILDELRGKIASGRFKLEEYVEKNATLERLEKEYLDLYARNNKEPRSLDIDRTAMADMATFFGAKRTVRPITQTDVLRFQNWLYNDKPRTTGKRANGVPVVDEESKGLTATTVNIKMRTLKAIFNWAKHENQRYIDRNPFAGVKELRSEKQLVFTMTPADVRAIFDQALADGKMGKKFIEFVSFLFMAACRRTEAVLMRWKQVDFEKREVKFVRTKGKKERAIPMNEEMKTLLLKIRNNAKGRCGPDDRLFIMSEDKPTKLFAKYRDAAGLRPELKLHSFRHTAARNFLMSGVNLADIKEILGHADIKTTELYLKSFPDGLRRAFESTSIKRFMDDGRAPSGHD